MANTVRAARHPARTGLSPSASTRARIPSVAIVYETDNVPADVADPPFHLPLVWASTAGVPRLRPSHRAPAVHGVPRGGIVVLGLFRYGP